MKYDLNTANGRYQARKAGFDVPKKKAGLPQIDPNNFITKTDTCWLWTGAVNQWGYGVYTRNYRRCFAHREAWEAHNRQSAKGLVIRHSCDNPRCVNPAHLSAGSHADNRADTISRNRQAKGERSAHAKLTEDQIRRIRERYKAKEITQKALAAVYGVSLDTIHKVVNRVYWKHVA